MFLEELRLINFRNYENLFLKFEKGLIFFVGENGEGKTNILEAIGFFSFLKSFRNNKEDDLIKWGQTNYFLTGKFKEKNSFKIEIGFENKPIKKRKIKYNENIIRKRTEIIGETLIVVFSPSDLRIIEDGPIERRRFVDSYISMFDRYYMELLQENNRILKQRNFLLKQKDFTYEQLKIWDEQFIEKGIKIKNIREDQIYYLKERFEKIIKNISGNKDEFKLNYRPNFKTIEEYSEKLNEKLQKDKKTGYTSVGIHKDDIFIGIDNKDILEFGSQGQKRSTVLALKTSVFELLKEKTKKSPILLIDDVIRELDIKRREFFIKVISQAEQTFFTTTDLEGIEDYVKLFPQKQIFQIQKNSLSFA